MTKYGRSIAIVSSLGDFRSDTVEQLACNLGCIAFSDEANFRRDRGESNRGEIGCSRTRTCLSHLGQVLITLPHVGR